MKLAVKCLLLAFTLTMRASALETYSNPHHGFSVSLPDGAKRVDDLSDECRAEFKLPENGRAIFAAVALEDPRTTLPTFAWQIVQPPVIDGRTNLFDVTDLKVKNWNDIEIARCPARRSEFTIVSAEGIDCQGMYFLIVGEGRGFFLYFETPVASYAARKNVIDWVIHSFKIIRTDGRKVSELIFKSNGVRLNYPATWTRQTTVTKGAVLWAPRREDGTFRESLVVDVKKDAAFRLHLTPESLVKWAYDELLLQPGVSSIAEPRKITIGRMDALRHSITREIKGVAVEQLMCGFIAGSRFLHLAYSIPAGAERLRKRFDEVLMSVQFDDETVKMVDCADIAGGFVIKHPDNWVVQPIPGTLTLFDPRIVAGSKDLFEAMVLATSEKIEVNDTLDAVMARGKASDAKDASLKVEAETELNFNGLRAVRMTHTFTSQNIKFRSVSVSLIHKQYFYTVQCMAPDSTFASLAARFDEIIDSFALLQNEGFGVALRLDPFERAHFLLEDYLVKGEALISDDVLAKAELGDHFETINLDRQDNGNAFGNPQSRRFTSVRGKEASGGGNGTYGLPDGGGRRLMVPRASVDLTKVVLNCARDGYLKRLKRSSPKNIAQIDAEVQRFVLGDETEIMAAAAALQKRDADAVNALINALEAQKDSKIADRIRELLLKVQLRCVVSEFRRTSAAVK